MPLTEDEVEDYDSAAYESPSGWRIFGNLILSALLLLLVFWPRIRPMVDPFLFQPAGVVGVGPCIVPHNGFISRYGPRQINANTLACYEGDDPFRHYPLALPAERGP